MFGLETSMEAVVAFAALLVSLVVFLLQQRKMIQLRKQENYLSLELSSNEVFRYEAEYGARLEPFMEETRPGEWTPGPGDESVAGNFYLQCLNLFEIALRLRQEGGFDPKILGSWVIWFHATTQSWYFRAQWPELRENYTDVLRDVFDEPVERYDEFAGDEERRAYFFGHVAKVMDCKIVRKWLKDLERKS
ncbi:hypothetical protein GCM10011367_27090 [Marinicauda pacifica]|jgi:hypothetical protein|uniref:DUF4760 domain-containing protein n=1 Tax=Marinicauda pacifica TaxID=1133559 RepID=A0A4V3RYW2_9PROT|nr:hypothetical protein [Marinicauda pacifica]TGY91709.1 hypothetical protein E5162_13895 [Marinicauda pacifica]GGE50756.1 hypothetical protein GCM10011367_27090 [Marinicauda pacifica]